MKLQNNTLNAIVSSIREQQGEEKKQKISAVRKSDKVKKLTDQSWKYFNLIPKKMRGATNCMKDMTKIDFENRAIDIFTPKAKYFEYDKCKNKVVILAESCETMGELMKKLKLKI